MTLISTSFVAVSGVGTKPSHEWTDEEGNLWLTAIKAPGIGLFSYEHGISKPDGSMWQALLDHGQILLKSILTLVETQHVHSLPFALQARVSLFLASFSTVRYCLLAIA